MRRAHHHAFENRLTSDQRFFATLKGGQELNGHQETHEISQRTHSFYVRLLDACYVKKYRSLGYHSEP
jgi:hypothetical protein